MGTQPKKILFIQHAGSLGGSSRSLLYTAIGLRKYGVASEIALIRPTQPLIDLYGTHGLATVPWPGIGTFEHTTLDWAAAGRPMSSARFIAARLRASQSRQRTLELIERSTADIVHLNSVVLLESAQALSRTGRRFVWHVREPPAAGYFGLRRQHIRRHLELPNVESIFLSEAERHAWRGEAGGNVIHNFVDFETFAASRDSTKTRLDLGATAETTVFLFLGGLGEAKGWPVLLRALAALKRKGIPFVCVMPSTSATAAASFLGKAARAILPLVGSGVALQRFEAALQESGLAGCVRRLPYVHDVERLISASDVVVFPAVRPHFARPVIEAAAVGKPTVASDWPGAAEIIDHGQTGFLVTPNDAVVLGDALERLATNPSLRSEMGEAARRLAKSRFSEAVQIPRLISIYEKLYD